MSTTVRSRAAQRNLGPFGYTSTPVTLNFGNCGSDARFLVTGALEANNGYAGGVLFFPDQQP